MDIATAKIIITLISVQNSQQPCLNNIVTEIIISTDREHQKTVATNIKYVIGYII